MTDQIVSRLGQRNAADDARELFLKLYAGEVLTTYKGTNIFKELHRTRTISNGKSAEFPLVGKTSAKYHTPGQLILGDQIKHGARVVTIDDLLISPQFIANIDEAMNHYDVRGIYSTEAGLALADVYDRNVARIIAKAGFITSATEAEAAFGSAFDDDVYTSPVTLSSDSNADAIAKGIKDAIKQLVKKKIIRNGSEATVVLPVDQYYALTDVTGSTKMIYMDRDFGGEGSAAAGVVPRVSGARILMSPNVPNEDESAGLISDPETPTSTRTAAYRGDYSKVRGLVFTKDAAATVQLMDLSVESEYQLSRQGTLTVAKYAVGHNMLRHECSVPLVV